MIKIVEISFRFGIVLGPDFCRVRSGDRHVLVAHHDPVCAFGWPDYAKNYASKLRRSYRRVPFLNTSAQRRKSAMMHHLLSPLLLPLLSPLFLLFLLQTNVISTVHLSKKVNNGLWTPDFAVIAT